MRFRPATLPTAALCYVWDNKHPRGLSVWNPYTDRVRTIVVQSGAPLSDAWVSETRDVAADFRASFAIEPPAINGIAIGNDTDQTGDRATVWFGDFAFRVRP